MQMTKEEFDRENRYQVIMHLVRKMLADGLISEEEYYQIDTKYREKFLPITGDLLSGITLLYTPSQSKHGSWKGGMKP